MDNMLLDGIKNELVSYYNLDLGDEDDLDMVSEPLVNSLTRGSPAIIHI